MVLALEHWTPTTENNPNGLIFEKECLPVGRLVKWVEGSNSNFDTTIQLDFLQRIVSNFQRFQDVGIRVPYYKTHVEDPDNDRGTVRNALIKKNKEGIDSLFTWVEFKDEKAKELALQCDVSVLCPPKFIDGKGNLYLYPLRHLAGTSKPVVPNLAPFTPVVLSFSSESGLMLDTTTKGSGMDTEKLAALLGLDAAADEAALLAAVDAMKDYIARLEAAIPQLGGDLEAVKAGSKVGGAAKPPEGEAPPAELSYPPMLTGQIAKARKAQVAALVEAGSITPAHAKSLESKYCTSDAITADLKLSSEETEFDRQLDTIKSMTKDRPLDTHNGTQGRKTLRLGEDGKPADSPTVAEAKRRAAARARK